jgi:PhoH-like ATPase
VSEKQNKKKLLVVDTSVLLYDKSCLIKLSSNDIVIPIVVLEELDRFKNKEGILGENSRYFNRYLDEIRENGSLQEGIVINEEHNSTLRVVSSLSWNNIDLLDKKDNDNVIIATTNYLKEIYHNEYKNIVLITKDINLRVKCDAANIKANDYYADYEFIQEDNLFKGFSVLKTSKNIIDALYSNKFINLSKIEEDTSGICENECIILKSPEESSALCIRKFNSLQLVMSKSEIQKKTGIEPKNKEQNFAMSLLLDDNIPLITLTGVPGSGKTYLALMTALKDIEKEKKKRIIFTRPIQTVGKDIGFLPGTLNEKMAPWLAPIVDNFRNQFGDLSYFDLMIEKGVIDVAPLSYIRGRSFNDAIIIVDEAQNATVHELKTVITRTGKNSKIILLGDIEQVDLPYVNKFSNGLTIVAEKLKNETVTGHVNFTKGYRSELANIAAEKL